MAEILFFVEDKTNDDKELNAQAYKRGDVVVVCPDGWPWGREELKDPRFRIVKVPGEPSEYLDLVQPQLAIKGDQLVTVRKRGRNLALDKLDAALMEKIDAVKQGDRLSVVALTEKEAADLAVARETKVIDEVIGVR